MNARVRSLCSVSALALLSAGCLQDPVEPEIIIDPLEPAAFEAVRADGAPLPALLAGDGAPSAGRQLTRASLLLSPPSSLRLILVTQAVAADGALGAAVHDTVHARLQPADSVVAVLAPMGTHPMRLRERITYDADGTLVLTVTQPLPPSAAEAAAARPVELHFRSVDYVP